MALPKAAAPVVKFVNKGLRHLAGLGPFVELEHLGRRSGKRYRTPLIASRRGDTFTFALPYGVDVDWLRNVRAAGGCRLRSGRTVLRLGAPTVVSESEGLARMPALARPVLPRVGCHDYVQMPVL